jgi:alpha-L-arabinofuranosidase
MKMPGRQLPISTRRSIPSLLFLSMMVFVPRPGAVGVGSCCEPTPVTRFIVTPRVLHAVDVRLFGQFLERASWGEPGPEAAVVPGTGQLQQSVIERLQEMRVPIVRFPGGIDVEHLDWTDMIDNVPGRGGPRPVSIGRPPFRGRITNHFGYDEYFALRDRLGSETILVVNLLNGVKAAAAGGSPREAALHSAGLVAYTNAQLAARLPEGMPDWPAVRAANGHPDPFRVEYVQVGNEMWTAQDAFREHGIQDHRVIADRMAGIYVEYIDLIREVDPTVKIIIDGPRSPNHPFLYRLIQDDRLLSRVDYLALHRYGPRHLVNLRKGWTEHDFRDLSAREYWEALVAHPGDISPADGQDWGLDRDLEWIRRAGDYRAAATEWNWIAQGHREIEPQPEIGTLLAGGLAAAGFLHGLMRQGDVLEIATQSMLVGVAWSLNSIRADPSGREPAYFFPTGQVTMFYRNRHGPQFLEVQSLNVPYYRQPYHLGRIRPMPRVAYLDVVATADEQKLYLHVINRNFEQDLPARFDLRAFNLTDRSAEHHVFTGRLHDEPRQGEPHEVGRFERLHAAVRGGELRLDLPARSVSIIEISRR